MTRLSWIIIWKAIYDEILHIMLLFIFFPTIFLLFKPLFGRFYSKSIINFNIIKLGFISFQLHILSSFIKKLKIWIWSALGAKLGKDVCYKLFSTNFVIGAANLYKGMAFQLHLLILKLKLSTKGHVFVCRITLNLVFCFLMTRLKTFCWNPYELV